MTRTTEPSLSNTLLQELSVRVTLASLWISLMLLYLYADVFSFYRPGMIDSVTAGNMGPFAVSQQALLLASVLMLIPALMCAGSFLFPRALTRRLHLGFGALYTLVNIGNLAGETWLYYLLYGGVECLLTVTLIARAWRWR
ncbi:MAG: DUF6326 family protein [Reinekea sp.]